MPSSQHVEGRAEIDKPFIFGRLYMYTGNFKPHCSNQILC